MSKISVIVPVYNVEKYLDRCVDSILNQTFSDFELILVDDGSTDNCGKLCDGYAEKDNRVVAIHKKNGGLSDARNAGLDWAFANSDSEYIAFVDSDDWVHKSFLEKLYYAINKEDADLSVCDSVRIDENNKEVIIPGDEYLKREIFSGEAGYHKMIHNWRLIVAWNKLYKKSTFNNLRYPVGRLYEDEYLIHHIFAECKKIVVLDEILYYYFQRPNSITNVKRGFKNREDNMGIFKDRFEFFGKIGQTELYKEWLDGYITCFASNVRYLHSEEKNKKNYRQYKKRFKSEVRKYKKDLTESPSKLYLKCVDHKNFDFGQRIYYAYNLVRFLGIKGILCKLMNKRDSQSL